MTLSPIVLFVYNRPWHTQQTIEALQQNELANESELFIYSDAPKNESAKDAVTEVRKLIKSIKGFKQVTVIEREKNWGLAESIIDGVTSIIKQYGKIIVLEDDLVTSPYFLKYMNEALEFYKDEEKVWHISGWNYPIEIEPAQDVFLWRVMNCWGWATWANKWQHYEKDVGKVISEFSSEEIKAFNLDGAENFFGQVITNKEKKINTWAIFWYATIFKRKGLCLNPTQTFVENIGHDGSGVHCGESNQFQSALSYNENIKFENKIYSNGAYTKKINIFYQKNKKSLIIRALNKVTRLTIGKNIF